MIIKHYRKVQNEKSQVVEPLDDNGEEYESQDIEQKTQSADEENDEEN